VSSPSTKLGDDGDRDYGDHDNVTMTEDQPLEVLNGGRKFTFTGQLLSRVSSERTHAPRWTVMELFKTVRGVYIVHRVGMSRVYHSPDCAVAATNRLAYGHELKDGPPSREALGNMTPCNVCRPLASDPSATMRFERERHWAGVAETPESAIEMMHRTNDGQRSLPWICENLITEAGKKDAAIADAYAVETIG
jgi:hypothetical protein